MEKKNISSTPTSLLTKLLTVHSRNNKRDSSGKWIILMVLPHEVVMQDDFLVLCPKLTWECDEVLTDSKNMKKFLT